MGVSFITPASELKPGFVIHLANKIEQSGLDSFWVSDRLAYDNLEPLSVLAAAAAVTNKINLGTSILLLPLRQPALVAKTLATVDFLSQGRLIVGIGLGNRVSDYEAVGVPFNQRGARSRESIHLIRRFWGGDEVTFHGKFYSPRELSIGPRPFEKRSIPIWMGGSAEPVLRSAAEHANGYICPTSALSNFRAIWQKIADYASAKGRDPRTIEKAGLNFLAIDDNTHKAVSRCNAYFKRYYGKEPQDIEKQMIVGPPSACADRIASLLERGLDHLIVGLIIADLKQIDILGERILPQIGQLRKGDRE